VSDAFFQFISTAERILLGGGVLLVVLGALAPTRLTGVRLEWPGNRSRNSVLLGIFLIILSSPFIRNWGEIDWQSLKDARGDAQLCSDRGYAAETNKSDVHTCNNRGGEAKNFGISAVTKIDRVLNAQKK
jgi:hypothetical protein